MAIELLEDFILNFSHKGSAGAQRPTDVNHHVALGTSITRREATALSALVLVKDADLSFARDDGHEGIVQLVGITADEEGLMAEWVAEELVAEMRRVDPFLLTDTRRRSLLETALGAGLRSRADAEGSRVAVVYPDVLAIRKSGLLTKRWEVITGPGDVARPNFPRLLRGRTRLGRPLSLVSPSTGEHLDITPAPAAAIRSTPRGAELLVSPALLSELLASIARGDALVRGASLPSFSIRFVENASDA